MSKRRSLLYLAVVLVLLAATLAVVFHGQSPGDLRSALSRAKPHYLLLGVGLIALFIGLEAACTHATLRTMGHGVPYRHCYTFSVAGFYFSSITPSATGGQPAQVFYMARRGVPAACGALDMLLVSLCYQVSTLLYALLAWVLVPAAARSLGVAMGVLLLYGAVTTGVLTALILLFMFRPRPAQALCDFFLRLGHRLHIVRDLDRSREKLAGQMAEYRRGAGLLRERPLLFPRLLLLTLLQLTCYYLVPWTVYRALGLTGVGVAELVAAQALLYLAVGALPLPGSVGASEAAFLSVFTAVFTPQLAAPAMLLSRGVSFYLPLLLTGLGSAALHLATRPKNQTSPAKSS